jgi:hypothetical protein
VADVGYHKVDSCPRDWWEPAVHVCFPCLDADVVGCIGSFLVEVVGDQVLYGDVYVHRLLYP